jgi:hypothetical protein
MLKLAMTLLALLIFAAPSDAAPTVSVHWGTCPFPANAPENRNAHTGPIETLSITVKGLSGTVRGAEIDLLFSDPYSPLPDAWRYDVDGCESGRLTYNAIPNSDPCPFLDNTNPLEVSQFGYDTTTMKARLVYARIYDTFIADPNQTYTLARFDFDHSAPDTCSCIERPICIHITKASYIDESINEYSFWLEREFVLWNDPANSTHCPDNGGELATRGDGTCSQPTAVSRRSWGSIKASYR